MNNNKVWAFKYFFCLVVTQPKLNLYNTQYEDWVKGGILGMLGHVGEREHIGLSSRVKIEQMYHFRDSIRPFKMEKCLSWFRIKPNLRSAVYLGGIKYGGKKEWDFMFQRYKKTQYPSEQRKVMFALTDTQDKTILKE